MYCPNCKMVVDETARCPVCGSRKIREPLPEDACFLTEADPISAGMLKDVLAQNHIPVLSSSTIGAGMAMRAGPMFERIRCYVRYDQLPEAMEIAEELFDTGGETQPEDEEED